MIKPPGKIKRLITTKRALAAEFVRLACLAHDPYEASDFRINAAEYSVKAAINDPSPSNILTAIDRLRTAMETCEPLSVEMLFLHVSMANVCIKAKNFEGTIAAMEAALAVLDDMITKLENNYNVSGPSDCYYQKKAYVLVSLAKQLKQRAGNEAKRAECLNLAAEVYGGKLKNYKEAIRLYKEAGKLFLQLGDTKGADIASANITKMKNEGQSLICAQ